MRSVASALALVLFVLAAVAFGLNVGRQRRMRSTGLHSRPQPVSLAVALLASVAAILVLTLSPMDDDNDVELLPLYDIVEALMPPVDAARLLTETANILLFVPLGAVLALRGFPISRTALIGLALSAAVEFAQLLVVSGRTTSVDDLLLNTLGAVLGHACLSRCLPFLKLSGTP